MIKGGPASLKKWILPVLILFATGIFVYIGLHRRMASNTGAGSGKIFLKLEPVQIHGGWGYLIYVNDSIYIRQTIIPAVPGTHPFRSREDALAIGQKVYDRLSAGQSPMVTAAEVRAMGVYPDTQNTK